MAIEKHDLLELAWGVIANAGGGDWTKESKDWQTAAETWRDAYHLYLATNEGAGVGKTEPGVNFTFKCAGCGVILVTAKEGPGGKCYSCGIQFFVQDGVVSWH